MLRYYVKRIVVAVVLLFAVSIASFIIIKLPPGDYVSRYIEAMRSRGQPVSDSQAEALREQYGLNRPKVVQYLIWIRNILRGDLGRSFEWGKPVTQLIQERILLTLIISFLIVVLAYAIAIPVGIFSATHQYQFLDHVITVIGFIGLGTPSFLLALILMFVFFKYFGLSVGGLFSPEFAQAPWSMARVLDLAKHLPAPVLLITVSGTSSLIRVMRGCLLDELRKPYVTTARAKGLGERSLLYKYPVRIALNPIISSLGWVLPWVFGGEALTSIVLNLPTVGPLLLRSLQAQDMYLAGSMILILAGLTVLGALISDMILAVVDPRISFGNK